MSLPLVNVLFEAEGPDGALVAGARVRARLTGYELDGTLIVPRTVEGVTDNTARKVLGLWPNTRGVRGSQYEVSITLDNKPLFSGLIVVPETDLADQPVPMRLLIQAAPPPALDAAQQALLQLQAAQIEIAASISSVKLIRPAAGPLGGSKVLRYTGAGTLDIASADDAGHRPLLAGVSVNAVSVAGEDVEYRRAGTLTDSGWAWAPGLPVYVGVGGALTQTYSAAWQWACIAGIAVTPTTLHLTFDPAILQT